METQIKQHVKQHDVTCFTWALNELNRFECHFSLSKIIVKNLSCNNH